MWKKRIGSFGRFERQAGRGFLLSVIIAAALGSGCKKKEKPEEETPGTPKSAQAVTSPDTVIRVHWLGKKRLAAETNAATFLEIWNLPESARLEAQTLDKLALAPWHPWTTNQVPV